MGTRTATALAAMLSIAMASASCSDARDRPFSSGMTGPAGSIDLEAVVINPDSVDVWFAGDTATITILANAASGRLSGLGYVVRRQPVGPVTLDSAVVTFDPTADTIIDFQLPIPDTLPNNAQLNVVGIAFGPDTAAVQSEPARVVVLECDEDPLYC